MRASLVSVLVLAGCMEIGVRPVGGDPSGTEGDTGEGGHQGNPTTETCNGLDDDLDGEIDEGFPDVDGDGIADCRDEDCEVASVDPSGTDRDLGCIDWTSEVEDPWDLLVEWHWSGDPSVSMPAVANLTDDDGDGDIDALDVPDVALVSYANGDIVALSGDAGVELWRAPGFRPDSGVAIADVDVDGRPEVIGITRDNRVRALRADGTELWTSAESFSLLYPIPTVADLDGDGLPEVIGDAAVLNGADGSTYARLDLDRTGPWRAPVVTDLDGDGLSEILLANDVFDHEGKLLWSLRPAPETLASFAAIVQADDDPMAEIAWAVGPDLVITDHDGTERARAPLSRRARPGPPCAGDIDGDGKPEVIVPASDRLTAFEVDGTELWSVAISDSSGAAGCIVFDMDGDAVYEVIYADMRDLRVFDGATGAIRYENGEHGSVTYFETPVVADIDADGSAEIIVSSSGYDGHSGVTVFGHAGDGWPPAGPAWPVHDYYVSNVTDGGSVPTDAEPGWRSHLVFRGRPATARTGLPDLAVSFVDACVASCEPGGLLRVAWQVRNEGERDVPAGTELALEAGEGKLRTRLRTVVLPAIPAGQTLASDTFDLPWTTVPEGGLHVVVDPADLVSECDEDDNSDSLLTLACWH